MLEGVFKKRRVAMGSLLLAQPFLADPDFVRTVILLAQHSPESSYGFVLNQSTEFCMSDIITDFPAPDAPVSLGGPVEKNTLHYIHPFGFLEGCYTLSEGLYQGGNFEQLQDFLFLGKIDAKSVRFFLGYAGWDKKQLDMEVAKKSWIVTPLQKDWVINPPQETNLWQHILKELGGEYKTIANFPLNPSLN